MRSSWRREAIIQYEWHPYKKGKFGHRHAHRKKMEAEIRVIDTSASQGMAMLANKHQRQPRAMELILPHSSQKEPSLTANNKLFFNSPVCGSPQQEAGPWLP